MRPFFAFVLWFLAALAITVVLGTVLDRRLVITQQTFDEPVQLPTVRDKP